MDSSEPQAIAKWQSYVVWSLLLATILFFAAVRYRLRDMPLERDEGEYAYAGQLILQGIPPYQLAYNMKLPGTYAAYAVFMAIFGQTDSGIRLATTVVNCATTFLIFLLAARLRGKWAGLVSAVSYAVLSTSQAILGFEGHATHFVVLAAVGGALVLLHAIESSKAVTYLLSGLLMGTAFVMKQPGIVFIAFGLAYLLKIDFKRVKPSATAQSAAAYLVGAAIPFLAVCVWMYVAGVFRKFWFWTFSYAAQYGTELTLREGLGLFAYRFPSIVRPTIGIWLIAIAGAFLFVWRRRKDRLGEFAFWLAVFGAAGVVPGLYFRRHYFIVLLPGLALLAGFVITTLVESSRKAIRMAAVGVFVVAVFLSIAVQSYFFFRIQPEVAARVTYGMNPFPEARRVAEYIRAHSSPDAKIAVIGSEPEIYFYAHRHSATGYIYTYPLMERQRYASFMQRDMAGEIERQKPEFVVLVGPPLSWTMQSYSDRFIFQWAESYVGKGFQVVGLADLGDPTQYRWGADVNGYRPRSRWVLWVFRRTQ